MEKAALPGPTRRTFLQWTLALLGLSTLLFFTGCASAPHSRPGLSHETPQTSSSPAVGIASFYASQYNGRKTASGERYDMNKMTAAHRTLPFGTRVRVTELSSNTSVVVRINDRGPFSRGRIIDLSLAAARRLGIVQKGSATVKLEPLSEGAQRAELIDR